jgi:hypothetical protein
MICTGQSGGQIQVWLLSPPHIFRQRAGSNSRSTVGDQGSPFGERYRSPLVQPALERPARGFLSHREQPLLAQLLARPPSWRGPCGIQGNWSAWHRFDADMVQLGPCLNHLGCLQESSGQRSRTVRAWKPEGPWQRGAADLWRCNRYKLSSTPFWCTLRTRIGWCTLSGDEFEFPTCQTNKLLNLKNWPQKTHQ